MDSNLLKVFVEVAKEKSISKAAIVLEYAQSNVTSRIQQLEKSLGYKLFHRVPKGVILTNEGERLYSHVQGCNFNFFDNFNRMRIWCIKSN